MSQLVDAFGRPITYMRVSITDRCNLRCVYCMPAEGIELKKHSDMLRVEEFVRIIRVAADLGIRRVRITGGEPLAHKGVVELVRDVAALPGISDVSMTTNATMLAPVAAELARAGLRRMNISLDSLRADTYAMLTRCGDLEAALAGLRAAEEAGLAPIKLNCVVLRGINDDEIEAMAGLTTEHPWDVRFIEFMPYWGNGGQFGPQHVLPVDEIRRRMRRMGARPDEAARDEGEACGAGGQGLGDAGPARYLRLPGAAGRVGLISRDGDEFCGACNRIRLTADGMFRPCLLSDSMIDVKTALRSGADDEAIARLVREAVAAKPESGRSRGAGGRWDAVPLSEIGG
jgi:cyclic pyranopterin phosphate synthase